MGISIGLNQEAEKIFKALYTKTNGDVSGQFSMYAIGEELGFSRDDARIASEMLMGENLVDIRTLSGSIGLTQDGVEYGLANVKTETGKPIGISALGASKILDEKTVESVGKTLAVLKSGFEDMGLSFEAASQLIADVKTAEMQLTSPKPKNAVIREVMTSVKDLLKSEGADSPVVKTVETLLG